MNLANQVALVTGAGQGIGKASALALAAAGAHVVAADIAAPKAEETAEAIGLSPATVKRRWTLAKAWLARELGAESRA